MRILDLKLVYAIAYVFLSSVVFTYYLSELPRHFANKYDLFFGFYFLGIVSFFIINKKILVKISAPQSQPGRYDFHLVGITCLLSYLWLVFLCIVIFFDKHSWDHIFFVDNLYDYLKPDAVRIAMMRISYCAFGFILFANTFFRVRLEKSRSILVFLSKYLLYVVIVVLCLMEMDVLTWIRHSP